MKTIPYFALFVLLVCTSISRPKGKKIERIVIDAAHGGKDNGAVYEDFSEKIITNDIALQIKDMAAKKGIEVVLLRKSDEFYDITDRVLKINEINPDLVISIHVNSSPNSEETGILGVVSKGNKFYPESFAVCNSILKQLAKTNLKTKEILETNLFILKNTTCPAVLLNIGYISNEKDRNFIGSREGQELLSKLIVKAIK